MSRHVAPHRWADALAGRVHRKQLAKMEVHASACTRCAVVRQDVERTVETFVAIRSQTSPPLSWDSVRARVHWSVSTAKHRRVVGSPLPSARMVGGGVALGVALAIAVYVGLPSRMAPVPPLARRDVLPPAASPPPPVTALVSRLAGAVLIDGISATTNDAFAKSLGAGTVLTTVEGRIDVQFGQASGFAVGPRSTLRVVRLDAEMIELAVEGVVDVNVGPRRPGERFLVNAGNQAIEVRGTRFVVARDARGTRVLCHHGLVTVRDNRRAASVEVGAARSAFIAADAALGEGDSPQLVSLSADDLAQFAKSEPWTTPFWSTELLEHSAALEIAAASKRSVRVDGVELGEAPLRMRVMPGRHTIETADGNGRFRRAGWIDVAPARGATFEVAEATSRPLSAGIAKRKSQFAAGIDRARLGACTRRLAKSGLTDTVHIEISVDAHGAVNVLNIVDTDLPSDTATCVHDVLSEVRFGAGPAASWRDRVDL